MSKKDKFLFVSAVQKIFGVSLLIACLFIPFGPAITLTSSTISKTYGSAFVFMFGGKISTINISYKTLGISIISLISYILLLLSFTMLITALITYRFKSNISKWLIFVSALMILASSIMFLCVHKSVSNVLADALIKTHKDTVSKTIYENTKLEYGFYAIPILGFISSLFLMASLIFDGTLDKVRAKTGII